MTTQMQPTICHLSGIAASTADALNGVIISLNQVRAEFPGTKVISVVLTPEMQPPSLGAPNGRMVYVAAAVLEMENEAEFIRLGEWSKANQPPGMRRV